MWLEILAAAVSLGLATALIVHTWQQADIFDSWRSAVEHWAFPPVDPDAPPEVDLPFRLKIRLFLGNLVFCRYCLSHHVAAWLYLLAVLPLTGCTAGCGLAELSKALIIWAAAVWVAVTVPPPQH